MRAPALPVRAPAAKTGRTLLALVHPDSYVAGGWSTLARAHAEVRVFRADEEEAAADADALYWDRIPMDDRAQFVWQLSLEMHALAHPEQPYDPGLSRSVARITGR